MDWLFGDLCGIIRWIVSVWPAEHVPSVGPLRLTHSRACLRWTTQRSITINNVTLRYRLKMSSSRLTRCKRC